MVSMRAALSVRAVEFGGLGRKVAVGLLSFCRSHAGWLGFRALLQCSKSCPIQAVAGAASAAGVASPEPRALFRVSLRPCLSARAASTLVEVEARASWDTPALAPTCGEGAAGGAVGVAAPEGGCAGGEHGWRRRGEEWWVRDPGDAVGQHRTHARRATQPRRSSDTTADSHAAFNIQHFLRQQQTNKQRAHHAPHTHFPL